MVDADGGGCCCTYYRFASLFLVILVPTCFWFHKPQPDICGEDFFLNTQHLQHWVQLYMVHPPLQRADVRQWNLHLLQGFITSGPFYLC